MNNNIIYQEYILFKRLLTFPIIRCSLRAALQIYFPGIRCKAQKDANSGTISAVKVGAKAGGPPSIGRRWGRKLIYHKNIIKALIFRNKYLRCSIFMTGGTNGKI
jgi:hypothetical protein